ncbi:MAG: hypothetical protein ABI192_10700 [Bradyrhizobium sp.]
MERRPNKEFGKRGPIAPQPAVPPKRSSHVALLLMGTFAVGGGAFALMPRQNCQPSAPIPQAGTDCAQRGATSSGGHGGSGSSWSRSNFFSSDTSSSSHAASGTSSDSGSSGAARGGFGSFAHAFSAHFSGGG